MDNKKRFSELKPKDIVYEIVSSEEDVEIVECKVKSNDGVKNEENNYSIVLTNKETFEFTERTYRSSSIYHKLYTERRGAVTACVIMLSHIADDIKEKMQFLDGEELEALKNRLEEIELKIKTLKESEEN